MKEKGGGEGEMKFCPLFPLDPCDFKSIHQENCQKYQVYKYGKKLPYAPLFLLNILKSKFYDLSQSQNHDFDLSHALLGHNHDFDLSQSHKILT